MQLLFDNPDGYPFEMNMFDVIDTDAFSSSPPPEKKKNKTETSCLFFKHKYHRAKLSKVSCFWMFLVFFSFFACFFPCKPSGSPVSSQGGLDSDVDLLLQQLEVRSENDSPPLKKLSR